MSLQWATVTATSPASVRVDGAATATPALVPTGVGLAAGQRVIVDLIGRQLVVVGAYAVPAAPAASAVYVPGDDGSVWQLKVHDDGMPYATKVS